MKLSKQMLIIGTVIGVVLISIIVFKIKGDGTEAVGKYDSLAKCLAGNGVKMYGAYWCPHCNNQKQMFGKSWKYINYIECSLPNRGGQVQICNQAGIKAYPTWEFQDGRRIEGELTFEQIMGYSNCQMEA